MLLKYDVSNFESVENNVEFAAIDKTDCFNTSHYDSDDSAYNALVQAVDEIRPYYDVDKIKTWAVYIWTKETDEDTGENVFDIEEDEVVFYNKEHIVPDEVIPIIKNIQFKLKALKQIRRFKKECVVIWQ